MAISSWQRYYLPVLDVLFPWRCQVCDSAMGFTVEQAICRRCLDQVQYIGSSVCRRCGTLFGRGGGAGYLCGECIKKPPEWDVSLSVIRYGPPVNTLLHRLKYNSDTTVLPALAEVITPFRANLKINCDIIVPVPLHRKRLRRRGLNQALYLAQLFFPEQVQLICSSALKRERYTQPQTGLDGGERRRNLRGAFSLCDNNVIHGKHVCLVDDVYTTGTTLNECSRILRKAGATKITVVTLARVIMTR